MRLYFVIAVFLCACTTPQARYAIDRAPATLADGQGMVIFSTTADEGCFATSVFIRVMKVEPRREVVVLPLDVGYFASDFPDHRGQLFAIPLDAGVYYLEPWLANPYTEGVRIPRALFIVEANTVSYVGEVYKVGGCALSSLIGARDSGDRDLAIAAQRNPSLDGREIVRRIVDFR